MNVSGIDGITLTKLDVLDTFKEIKICMGYKLKEKKLIIFLKMSMNKNLEPIYEVHKGWLESTQRAKSWSELPALAINL